MAFKTSEYTGCYKYDINITLFLPILRLVSIVIYQGFVI